MTRAAAAAASRNVQNHGWALAAFVHQEKWNIVERDDEDADLAGPSSASDAGSLHEEALRFESARETDKTSSMAVGAGSMARAA